MFKSTERVIFWLRDSDNPDRFDIVVQEPRIKKTLGVQRLDRLSCDGCPDGIIQFAREPVEHFAPYLDEVGLKFKKGVSREVPDRLSYKGHTIVSERCRKVIERIDPDGGHLYMPTRILSEDGEQLGRQYFYMWCGRIYASRERSNTSSITTDAIGNGYHYHTTLATPDRFEFFEHMPVWSGSTVARGPDFLSRSVFEQIKDAGLTGFREYTHRHGMDLKDDHDTWADVITPQNVAHIWM
ncbi:imm11 family protein [Gymnodinialimonas hymeniacidonis]|uniref:imm11 family protein n=1 Tax=Gymnodinialimonas hymeniacidonis TaxID=3126508 RepID=UPI0034C688DE